MTTLAIPKDHKVDLPAPEDRTFMLLGAPTRAVVEREIEIRSQFAEGLNCQYWRTVLERGLPEEPEEEHIRVVTFEPATIRVVAEIISSAARLKPTRLLEFEE